MRTLLAIVVFTFLGAASYAQTCTFTNVTPSIPTPRPTATIPTPPATATDPNKDPCSVDNCPAIGTMCSDGSLYAGISPDGNMRMFTTPCNYGATWDGSACTNSGTTVQWSTFQPNSPTTGSNTGRTNTANIIALLGNNGTAAKACASITGYPAGNDWYLPGISELSVLYTNRAVLNFNTAFYWSSTDFVSNRAGAFYKDFSDGSSSTQSKINSSRIRCVRRETYK